MSKAPPEPGVENVPGVNAVKGDGVHHAVKGNFKRDYGANAWYTTHRSDSVYIARRFADWIVIEIPGGWLTSGEAIMRVGDAEIFANSNQKLPEDIGYWLRSEDKLRRDHKKGELMEIPVLSVYVIEQLNVFILPTKPARIHNSAAYLSWQNRDCYDIVKRGLQEIREEFLLYERYASNTGAEAPRLVLRPPGTTGYYSGLTLRKSMRLMKESFAVTGDRNRTHIPVVVVSKTKILSTFR